MQTTRYVFEIHFLLYQRADRPEIG